MPKQSPKKNSNWFRIERIAQALSEETGESADTLEQDLEKWNSNFIRQKQSTITETSDDDGETTRLFYGSLFGQIQRKVLEAYCSDRGYKKPCLWLTGEVGRSKLSGPSVVEARLAGQPGPEARPVQAVEESPIESPSGTLVKPSYPVKEAKASVETSNAEATRLGEQLATTRRELEAVRQKAGARAEVERQKPTRAAETATAVAVAVREQLETARQEIANLNRAVKRRLVSEFKPEGPTTKQSNPMVESERRTDMTEPQSARRYEASRRVGQTFPKSRRFRIAGALAIGLIILSGVLILWDGSTVEEVGEVHFDARQELQPVGQNAGARAEVERQESIRAAQNSPAEGGAVKEELEATQQQITNPGAAVEASESGVAQGDVQSGGDQQLEPVPRLDGAEEAHPMSSQSAPEVPQHLPESTQDQSNGSALMQGALAGELGLSTSPNRDYSITDLNKFACLRDQMVRVIYVQYHRSVGDPPCSVIYEKSISDGSSAEVVWQATREKGYCEARARAFVQRLRGLNWKCGFYRDVLGITE